jgi:sulfur relay (sulfurtransferase) DsrC/TusE family protein
MDDEPSKLKHFYTDFKTAPKNRGFNTTHESRMNALVSYVSAVYKKPPPSSLLDGDGMLTRSTTKTTAAAAAAASDDDDDDDDNNDDDDDDDDDDDEDDDDDDDVGDDEEVNNSDKEDILSSHHKNATPFQNSKTVFKDNNVEMIVRRTTFARQKKFNIDDHHFQVNVKIRNEELDKPLLESMLGALGSALLEILVQLRHFYSDHNRFIYVVSKYYFGKYSLGPISGLQA